MDYISGERAACLFKGITREPYVVLLLHSANVRVNEVRLLSLGALRHHSSDCLSAATYGRWIRFAVHAHPLATLLRKVPRVARRGT